MTTEAVHNDIAEGEDATSYGEEEDASDDFSGTEDDSSDDDFEFKDLEKEIYGRLGGPPPELKDAIGMIATIDQKDVKSSSNKEKKQPTSVKKEPKINRTPLQEITSKDNEKTMDENKAKQIIETVTQSKVAALAKTIPAMEAAVMTSEETKNTPTIKNSNNVNQSSADKVESVKKGKDEDEPPKDDCGCTVM
jgi:hypothetical protein